MRNDADPDSDRAYFDSEFQLYITPCVMYTCMYKQFKVGDSPLLLHSLLTVSTISSRKYITFLHTAFGQKWRGGVCSNIQLVSSLRPQIPQDVMHEVDYCGFLELRKAKHVLWETTPVKLVLGATKTYAVNEAGDFMCARL